MSSRLLALVALGCVPLLSSCATDPDTTFEFAADAVNPRELTAIFR